MKNQQHPDRFDWATELSDAQGRVTLSEQEAKEIGARLRSIGEKLKAYEDLGEAASDVQLLRTGYAAARLEIESLRGRVGVAPAGEYPPQEVSETLRSILIRCREFIDTTKVPAYPAGADLADEIDVLLAAQPAPAPLSDDVMKDAAFEAVRKKLCALPRFSFLSDGYGVRRVPDKSGSWIAFDAAHALFDPVAVDAALAAQGGK